VWGFVQCAGVRCWPCCPPRCAALPPMRPRPAGGRARVRFRFPVDDGAPPRESHRPFCLAGQEKEGVCADSGHQSPGFVALWLAACSAQQTNGGGPESQRPQRAAGWDGTCSSDTGFFCSCSSKPGSVVALATSVPVRTRRNGLFRKPTPSSQQRLIQNRPVACVVAPPVIP